MQLQFRTFLNYLLAQLQSTFSNCFFYAVTVFNFFLNHLLVQFEERKKRAKTRGRERNEKR